LQTFLNERALIKSGQALGLGISLAWLSKAL
jgi:hypothetical protein